MFIIHSPDQAAKCTTVQRRLAALDLEPIVPPTRKRQRSLSPQPSQQSPLPIPGLLKGKGVDREVRQGDDTHTSHDDIPQVKHHRMTPLDPPQLSSQMASQNLSKMLIGNAVARPDVSRARGGSDATTILNASHGTGNIIAQEGDQVTIQYIGHLNEPQGTVFDQHASTPGFKLILGDTSILRSASRYST